MYSSLATSSAGDLPRRPSPYAGPERRSADSALSRCLAQTLDEVDYGMLLLDADGRLLHANQAARAELDDGHPLQMLGAELRARHSHDVVPLHEALDAAARRGLRRLLSLGDGDVQIGVAVVPLPGAVAGQHATLILMGKRAVCEDLSVQCYARSQHLTPTEERVLRQLCRGVTPREIAAAHGVGIATVRTQIGSIRNKTQTASIRALVSLVAKLPPMVGVLRSAGAAAVTMAACRPPAPHRVT